jgi:hypothetical protein
MQAPMNIRRGLSYGVLLLGIIFSAIVVAAFPDFYHHSDVQVFMVWAQQWNHGWTEIYNTCPGCNYPLFGIFSTAGAIKLLTKVGISDVALGFRFGLAAVDGINVLLVFLLFRELKIKHAALWAGIIGLLPSSWVGGGVWGQIEGISQCMHLLIVLWIVWCNRTAKVPFAFYLAICSLGMAALLLTKQVNLFSVAAMEFFLMVQIFSGRKRLPAAGYFLLQAALLLIFTFAWDLPLNIEGGLFSNLQVAWGARSNAGGFLAQNGINLWVLLNRPMTSPSNILLFPGLPSGISQWITPFIVGVVLFLAAAAVLSASMARKAAGIPALESPYRNREMMLNFILYLAIVILAFNVLLTGNRMRYLYPFYPFVIMACLGLREFSRRFPPLLAALLIIGANIYGVFVLGILNGELVYRIEPHGILAVFHGVLLVWLMAAALRYQGWPPFGFPQAAVRRLENPPAEKIGP